MSLPPEAFFEGTPPHVRAYIEQLHATIDDLYTRMAELESKQAKNSTNSSLPPSSEHPHAKPVRHAPKSPRRSGGQPGHAKHERPLLPTEQCQQVIPCVPPTCRRCAAPLSGSDPQPLRHQVWELPEIKPSVTEYQRHRLACRCGTVTCGALPAGVPTGQAGPRLIAFSGLLMSCFRQSKRRAALFLSMILNQPACPGWMVSLQKLAAEAVQPAYDELVRELRQQAVLYIDESPTKEGKTKSWIWTFVAATFTLFATRTSRAADILTDWLGEAYTGVIHCDRARMYWSFGRLQWCWAHLKRDFQGCKEPLSARWCSAPRRSSSLVLLGAHSLLPQPRTCPTGCSLSVTLFLPSLRTTTSDILFPAFIPAPTLILPRRPTDSQLSPTPTAVPSVAML
jgi:transposase